ncbi:hypothetical protein F4776DRAFT_647456 [Hypoxylon sp. NC0597]|nr:hypothetical protein F4776DRAFT_647456 [Hypoxylon sp. NC0597]
MQDAWNLPWLYSCRGKTRVILQSSAICPLDSQREGLTEAYTQEAVFIKNVAPSDSWYASLPGSLPTINHSVSGHDSTEPQTSVALGKVGNGWLGFIGDIENREETAAVLVAMMGLDAME